MPGGPFRGTGLQARISRGQPKLHALFVQGFRCAVGVKQQAIVDRKLKGEVGGDSIEDFSTVNAQSHALRCQFVDALVRRSIKQGRIVTCTSESYAGALLSR